MDVSGKVGLVTGGADGIGKVVVENLLRRGAKGVAFLDLNVSKGIETCDELGMTYGRDRIIFCKTDVSCRADLQGAFRKTKETFGELHIVCNNAGIADEVNWENMFRVNLNGTIYGTLLAIQYMDDAEVGGVVINISSAAGVIGAARVPHYSASKAAVNGFSRNIALCDPTVLKKRIRVNIVCPLRVDKPMSENSRFAEDAKTKEHLASMLDPEQKVTSGKVVCTMQDVADTMLMLIEENHNAQTAFVFPGKPTIVADSYLRFQKDVLNLDDDYFTKLVKKFSIVK